MEVNLFVFLSNVICNADPFNNMDRYIFSKDYHEGYTGFNQTKKGPLGSLMSTIEGKERKSTQKEVILSCTFGGVDLHYANLKQ